MSDEESFLRVAREELARAAEEGAAVSIIHGRITKQKLKLQLKAVTVFNPEIPVVYTPWVKQNMIMIVLTMMEGTE
jgi:hypothetical protein